MKKRKLLIPVFATAVILGSCQFESFDKRCARESMEYTEQHCPLRIDPCTVLDSMTYDIDNRTLQYHYTLEGILDSANTLTPEVVEGFTQQLKNDIINSVQLRKYKKERINFKYIYKSKATGKTSLSIKFAPQDYETTPAEAR